MCSQWLGRGVWTDFGSHPTPPHTLPLSLRHGFPPRFDTPRTLTSLASPVRVSAEDLPALGPARRRLLLADAEDQVALPEDPLRPRRLPVRGRGLGQREAVHGHDLELRQHLGAVDRSIGRAPPSKPRHRPDVGSLRAWLPLQAQHGPHARGPGQESVRPRADSGETGCTTRRPGHTTREAKAATPKEGRPRAGPRSALGSSTRIFECFKLFVVEFEVVRGVRGVI